MSLTKLQVQSKYPEVYESYTMQAAVAEPKYEEKLKFWESHGITCFERWTIPYFLEREREKKRPCLRLNHPPDGKCNDCSRNTCRYDKICFMCGLEGHGAFQTFPGGKMKGEMKCTKHRNFLYQLGMIRLQHGVDEDGLRVMFKLPPNPMDATIPTTAPLQGTAPAAAPAAPVTNSGAGVVKKNQQQYSANSNISSVHGSPSTQSEVSTSMGSHDFNQPEVSDFSLGKHSPGNTSYVASVISAQSNELLIDDNQNGKGKGRGNHPNTKYSPQTEMPVPFNSIKSVGPLPSAHNNAPPGISVATTAPTAAVSGMGAGSGSGMNLSDWLVGSNNSSPLRNGNETALAAGSNNINNSIALNSSHMGGGRSIMSTNGSVGSLSSDHLASLSMSGLSVNAGSNNLGSVSPNLQQQKQSQPQHQSQDGSFGNFNSLLGSDAASLINGGAYHGGAAVISVIDVNSDEYNKSAALKYSPAALTYNPLLGMHTAKGEMVFKSISGCNTATAVLRPLEVSICGWRKATSDAGSAVSLTALCKEVKLLRIAAKKSLNIAKILHVGVLDLISSSAGGYSTELYGLMFETSELGTLRTFVDSNKQLQQQQRQRQRLFSVYDMQSACVQLMEAVIDCHELGIKHRDIRPENILVCRADDHYQRKQIAHSTATDANNALTADYGIILKITNFTPVSVCECSSFSAEDVWFAPEVDTDARRSGARFNPMSDVWSLGLLFYYLASNGQLPFESREQAILAGKNQEVGRTCLEKHGLHSNCPMLYDLIERMLRPLYTRVELKTARCHPFLWSMQCRKRMLINFATASRIQGSDTINNFVTRIDKISPLYVFGQEGWVQAMSPALAAHVHPPMLKTDFWWSGTYFLLAIKNQLLQPDAMQQAVYPNLTVHQAVNAYLHQITDVDFPRLLILLFELGGMYGKWTWDGDEVLHQWN